MHEDDGSGDVTVWNDCGKVAEGGEVTDGDKVRSDGDEKADGKVVGDGTGSDNLAVPGGGTFGAGELLNITVA